MGNKVSSIIPEESIPLPAKSIPLPVENVPKNNDKQTDATQGVIEILNNNSINNKTKFKQISELLKTEYIFKYNKLEYSELLRLAFSKKNEELILLLLENIYKPIKGKPLESDDIIFDYALEYKMYEVIEKLIINGYKVKNKNIQILTNNFRKKTPNIQHIKNMTKINNISKKISFDPNRLTGINRPNTAYVMMGHGYEEDEKLIVPKGCILVVQVHSGESNYFADTFFKNLFKYPNKDHFLDPDKYYNKLITHIKTFYTYTKHVNLAIYKEGDICPNLFYSLISHYKKPTGIIGLSDSGIAQYPFEYIEDRPNYYFENTKLINNEFEEVFDKSIYPTQQEIKKVIHNMEELPTIDNITNNNEIMRLTDKTLDKLFEKLGPGVYYSFLCRNVKNLPNVHNNFILNNVFRNRLSEAILQRKRYELKQFTKDNTNNSEKNNMINNRINKLENSTRLEDLYVIFDKINHYFEKLNLKQIIKLRDFLLKIRLMYEKTQIITDSEIGLLKRLDLVQSVPMSLDEYKTIYINLINRDLERLTSFIPKTNNINKKAIAKTLKNKLVPINWRNNNTRRKIITRNTRNLPRN